MLYHELSSLEHAGATFFDGSGIWDLRVSASARSSFQSWMAKQTTELDGADVDEDAVVFRRVSDNGGTIQTQAEAEAVLRVERRTGGDDETELDHDGLVTSRQVGDAPEEDDDEEDEEGMSEDSVEEGDGGGLRVVGKAELKAANEAFVRTLLRRINRKQLNLGDHRSVPSLTILPPDPDREVS